ncbi:MAG: BlaI/MecI/CopY family transcriptional regulator [Candidatus Methylomirabilaceae bacterium]
MTAEPDIGLFRLDRPGIRKVLGDLEAEVMELVWSPSAGRGIIVRHVFERLSRRRRIAYTTVMTTMARLARKNLLRVEKRATAYVYYPTCSRDEFVSCIVGRILENLLVSFTGPTIERLKALADPRADKDGVIRSKLVRPFLGPEGLKELQRRIRTVAP